MNKCLLCMFIVLTLLMASCLSPVGVEKESESSMEVGEVWSSKGGAFKQSDFHLPDNTVFFNIDGAEIYGITYDVLGAGDGNSNYDVFWNSASIYEPESGSIDYVAASGEGGLWLAETVLLDTVSVTQLELISFTGEVIRTVPVSEIGFVESLLVGSENLFIKSMDRFFILNDIGEIALSYELSDVSSRLISGSDGNVYIVDYYEDRTEVSRVNKTVITPVLSLPVVGAKIFCGNEAYCFILSDDEGLFGLDIYGELSPVIIWDDCGISVSDVKNVFAMPNGSYLLRDTAAVSELTPVDPSDLGKKTELTLALVGEPEGISAVVSSFNRNNSEFFLTIKDYSDNCSYSTNEAITKLNTDILSGIYPDLFYFSNLSPFTYINKGYLFDLKALIDNDSEISGADIAILDKLKVGDGVYYLSSTFNIATVSARYSEFGDRTGWSLDEYLEIEANMPANTETMYNVTKPFFLRRISERYLRTAVDWEAGKCDFDNGTFISMLEASSRIKENPEPENPSELNYTYGTVRVGDGSLVAVSSWVDSVWKLAFEEKMAKCRLSFIGWPTDNGSCGSDIYISAPAGVCSQSKHVDGCWEFLKHMLRYVDTDDPSRLPVYMPYLRSQVEQATKEKAYDGTQMTDEDAGRFFSLLEDIDNVALYDETILRIIDEEASAFFTGAKTAAETAALIQSRVSLYVAEQG